MLCWNKLGMFDSLTFLPLVPGGEGGEWPTSWSQDDCRGSGRERPIRSSRRWCASCFFYHYHLFSIDILPAVLEALSQRRHHVLVVFHQGSEEMGHSPLVRNMAQVTYLSMEEYFDTSSRFKSSGKSLRMWKARMYSSCCGEEVIFCISSPKLKAW